MESTERHNRIDGHRPLLGTRVHAIKRRRVDPPNHDLWSTLAGAIACERPAFAWLRGDTHTLALDDAPHSAQAWQCLAWRFDTARSGDLWHAWPRQMTRTPAAVATWKAGACTAFIQATFDGWPHQDLAPTPADSDAHPVAESVESKASWMARVEAAEAACQAGLLHKVVLARATRHAGAMCAVSTLRALHARHPEATIFCVSNGRDVFLGATPETLAEIAYDRLSTHALAGTRRRGLDDAEDRRLAEALQRSVKERREHSAVVEDLADTLAPLCTALDWSATPRVKTLATVQHLETPFEGRLRPHVDALQVAEALHPTAALSGLPRAAARAWLREHEALDRGLYGAPIGWLDHGRAHLAVAIRSALITPNAAFTFAGAGIVAGSDPQAEWVETQIKQASVAQALCRAGPS